MTWKEALRQLENKKDWDAAIEYMQYIIHDNPEDMDAYICMNYLLMNLLVEEDHSNIDSNKFDYYARLAKHYFDISYSRFSENAEYLFYTGITAVMSEWFWDIEVEDYERMIKKAVQLEPDNLVFRRDRIIHLDHKDPANHKELKEYYEMALDENSNLHRTLKSKGAVGEYLLDMTTYGGKQFLRGEYR